MGLRLLPHELRQLRGMVAELCTFHAAHVVDAGARCLSLPGPVADQVFLFSLEEIFLLQDLLTSAGLLLEVDKILERPVGS